MATVKHSCRLHLFKRHSNRVLERILGQRNSPMGKAHSREQPRPLLGPQRQRLVPCVFVQRRPAPVRSMRFARATRRAIGRSSFQWQSAGYLLERLLNGKLSHRPGTGRLCNSCPQGKTRRWIPIYTIGGMVLHREPFSIWMFVRKVLNSSQLLGSTWGMVPSSRTLVT